MPPLKELPPAHAGIAAALGSWHEHDGRKHDLCGAVGGLMRKLGFSRAACEAEIRAWLADAPATVDVAHGVAWACAAWDKPADDVSGHAALVGLLGESHAAIVERAAQLATPFGAWLAARPLVEAPAAATAWAKPVDYGDPLGRRRSFSDPEAPLEYYCEGLRLAPSQGKISLLAGQPGAGKGPIADHLAICFTFGLPAFGRFPCRKSRTLVLDCEGAFLTMRRMRRMCRALNVDARDLQDVRDVTGMKLLDDTFLGALQADAPEVVILDSYTSAMLMTGVDTFKPDFAMLASALGSLGALVLSVAHANKVPAQGERPTLGHVAGSFALAAFAQTGVCVWHPDLEKAPNRLRLGCMRAPETPFETFDVMFRDVAACDGLALEQVDKADDDRQAADVARATIAAHCNRVLFFLREQGVRAFSKTKIREASKLNDTNANEALYLLSAAGFVHRTADKGGLVYALNHSAAPAHVRLDEAGACVAADGVAGFARPPA